MGQELCLLYLLLSLVPRTVHNTVMKMLACSPNVLMEIIF